MTGKALSLIAVVTLVSSVVALSGQTTPQRPTFRTGTAVVAVDVSVRRGNVPVAGLTSGDFDLLDNGVAQRIESVSVEAVPIDVSLVVDTSGSVINNFFEFKDDVKQFARMLRPVDRVRVVSFGTGVQEIIPMQSAALPLKLDALQQGGNTASNDGLFYGLLWPTDVDRRHLVIAMTDGVDNYSTLSSASIVDVAERTSAVFHVILVSGIAPTTTWEEGSRKAVVEAVGRTGGEVHKPGRARNDFKAIFEDFRASYVLRYTPEGVSQTGWHDLTVKLVRLDPAQHTVRARRGYWGATR